VPSISVPEPAALVIGIVSDTHGYLDPELLRVFEHAQCIVHAGDVGKTEVLRELEAIAPVFAVRGNVDRDAGLCDLPERLDLALAGISIHIAHRLEDARPSPKTRVLIHGHSHRPVQEWRGNILYVNPGAAGRQGFHVERTAAVLDLTGTPTCVLVDLGPKAAGRAPERRRVQ
jgi:putative phosphoesterase